MIIGPILAKIGIQWDKYAVEVSEQWLPATTRLTAGAILGVVLVALAIVGKLKINGAWTFLMISFILAYLLQTVIADLVSFLGLALGGATIDHIFIQGNVRTLRMKINAEATSDVMANAVAKGVEMAMKKQV